MTKQFDVIIIGGGLVANSLLVALRSLPLSVAVIEAKPRQDSASQAEGRTFALSPATRQFFLSCATWPAAHATPIKKIHVSQSGGFAVTRLDADEHGLAALGYVVKAAELMRDLSEQAQSLATWLRPASCLDIEASEAGYHITVDYQGEQHPLACQVLIAADGSDSSVARRLGYQRQATDYQETAIATQIELSQPHQFCAYERFTADGPLALLPRSGDAMGLVWVAPCEKAQALLALNDQDFLQQAQAAFGYRVGRWQGVAARFSYPLIASETKQPKGKPLIFLGNAAQTLHPVAAQGFNLAIRDCAILADVWQQALERSQGLGDPAVLAQFHQWRSSHQQNIMGITHLLAKSFLPQSWLMASIRGTGLQLLDSLPPLKRRFLQLMMGFAGKTPRLMCHPHSCGLFS